MGLRKGHCYSRIKRAYTRKSKFKTKGYIKAIPQQKVIKFAMGDEKKPFSHQLALISRQAIQIRNNAIESSRTVVNRQLMVALGNNYVMKIKIYPHHVLRENKMITGAGADRMSKGMQLAFGRAIGTAAQLRKNQPVFTVNVDESNIIAAKDALSRAVPRLPGKYQIVITKTAS